MKYQKLICVVLIQLIVISTASVSFAASIGAITDGFWNSSLTWTPATIPGSGDTVFIGSTSPVGASSTATVTLTQDQSASNVYLGYGSGTAGTLDLGNSKLTIGSGLYLGYSSGSTGTILRGTGYFTATSLSVDNSNTFAFGALDAVSSLNLSNSSTATTTAVGNVTSGVGISSKSKLTLGADMTLSGNMDVRDTDSILDMAGHTLHANQFFFGWNGGSPTLDNRVPFTVNNLYVANKTFDLYASDTVSNFNLSNATSTINTPLSGLSLSNSSTATTTTAGNVTSGVGISSKSKLTLGADMTLSGNMDVRDTDSILDMAGHTLHANQFFFGWNGGSPTLDNRVPFTVNNLYVANKTFDLYASDTVSNFNLSNATSTINTPLSGLSLSNSSTATTTTAGNVTSSVGIYSKSKLTLGADMTLSGNMDVRDTDSILDMAGHTLHANQFLFGWYGGSPTLDNRVPFTVNNLYVGNKTFDLYASDTVSNF